MKCKKAFFQITSQVSSNGSVNVSLIRTCNNVKLWVDGFEIVWNNFSRNPIPPPPANATPPPPKFQDLALTQQHSGMSFCFP